MTIIYLFITILISCIAASVALYNLVTNPVLQYRPRPASKIKPLVSILIPARNEAKSIERLLYTIMQQTYRKIEIVVLDDHSEDRTWAIAASVAHVEPRLRVVKGKKLPEGWTGKNWACHQLAREAAGEILLFIDADVQLAPEAVSSAVFSMEENRLSMLSVFPTQIMQSFGERLIVPLMNWLLLSFLPLRMVYSSSNPKFVAANGQFILIRNDIYSDIGGHEAVSDRIVEDMEIARILKRSGKRIMTLLGGELVSCRMYSGIQDAVNGFTKNFYPGFNTAQHIFLAMLILLLAVFLLPFVAVIESGLFIYPILAIVANRIFVSIISKQSILYNILLHPLHMLMMVIIGVRSVEAYTKGRIIWKGRRI